MVSALSTRGRRIAGRLQLDHVLSDMVSQQPGQRAVATSGASIGPCPFRHGKPFLTFPPSTLAPLLQLDHVLSDMVRAEPEPSLDGDDRASIGPCPFRHGKGPVPEALQPHPARFNWTMSFQTW